MLMGTKVSVTGCVLYKKMLSQSLGCKILLGINTLERKGEDQVGQRRSQTVMQV